MDYLEHEQLTEYCEFAKWLMPQVAQCVEANFDNKFDRQQAMLATISNLLLVLASSYPPDERVERLNNFLISFKRILPDHLEGTNG